MISKSCTPLPQKNGTTQPPQCWLPALHHAGARHCQPHAKPSAWHARCGACSLLHSPPGTGARACPLLSALPGSLQIPGCLFLHPHKPAARKLRLSQKGWLAAVPGKGTGKTGGQPLHGAQADSPDPLAHRRTWLTARCCRASRHGPSRGIWKAQPGMLRALPATGRTLHRSCSPGSPSRRGCSLAQPSQGSRLSSSGCTPGRGRPPSSCSHRAEQKQREEKEKLGILA